MEAKQIGTGKFEVMSDSGHIYQVSNQSCSCPHYQYRLAVKGEKCKHMIFISNIKLKEKEESQILKYLKKEKIASHNILEKLFGNIDKEIKMLTEDGDIYYDKKKDSYICW